MMRLVNLLPFDGEAYYYDSILTAAEAETSFNSLLEQVEWRHDESVIFGRHILTKRKVAWYGNESYPYRYSGTTKHASSWTPALSKIKARVERVAQSHFNSCLLNFYHSGEEGMGWHADNEPCLHPQSSIASLSLGAERKFYFKHRVSGNPVSIVLESGSLLIMKGKTQTSWLHSLPKTKKISAPRINLTFRTYCPA